MERGLMNYAVDLWNQATQYPCGWLRPEVVRGRFVDGEIGQLQRLFFDELRTQGFKRTPWQLVFPGQTAGIIKPILHPVQSDQVGEYHVRFYDDGVIDCELEVARFHSMHWVGQRSHSIEPLNEFLDQAVVISCAQTKERIRKLFGVRSF